MLKRLTVPLLLLATSASAAPHPLEQSEDHEWVKTGNLAVAFGMLAAKSGLRGTHSKGACVYADLQILDPAASSEVPAAEASKLKVGLFATPATYPARVRFANAASRIVADQEYDGRAISFSVELPAG